MVKIKKNKKYGLGLISLILLLTCLPLIMNASNVVIELNYNIFLKNQLHKSNNALVRENQMLDVLAKKLAQEKELPGLIQLGDVQKIFNFLQSQKKPDTAALLMVTDANGTVLSRSKLPDVIGDNIFLTTPWGYDLYSRGSTAMISASNRLPLVMIAGQEIKQADKKIGALFVGHSLDNDFAKYFQKKYLPSGSNILFYDKNRGIVGSSFDDKFISQRLGLPLNASADWIKNNVDSIPEYVKIGGLTFYVGQIKLNPNQDNIGALIFIPHQNYLISLILGVIFSSLVILFYNNYCTDKCFFLRFRKKKKSQNKKRRLLLYALIFIIVFFINNYFISRNYKRIQAPAYKLYNSTLKLSPDFDQWAKNFEHRLSVLVTPGDEEINAAQIEIKYDPRIIEVRHIDTQNSICNPSLIIENKIDNIKGLIQFACLLKEKKYGLGDKELFSLVAKPLKEDYFDIDFTGNNQILANDGMGTNVLRQAVGGYYKIYDDEEDWRDTINVSSPTHPNSNRWYSNKNIKFFWQNVGQSYYYSLDKNKNENLKTMPNTKRNDIDLRVADDGVYYFHLAPKINNSLKGATTYKVKIDSTGPQINNVLFSDKKIKAGEVLRLSFVSEDELSGVQSNYLKINDNIFLPVNQEIFIPLTKSGKNTLTIRSFDNANNYSDHQIEVDVVDKNILEKIKNIDWPDL